MANDSPGPGPGTYQRTITKSNEDKTSLDFARNDVPQPAQIYKLWQGHQGWGVWPPSRRHDAILIGQWTKRKFPLAFWVLAIERVPRGYPFRWLTHPYEAGKTGRLEQWFLDWKQEQQPAPLPKLTQFALKSLDPHPAA